MVPSETFDIYHRASDDTGRMSHNFSSNVVQKPALVSSVQKYLLEKGYIINTQCLEL